MTQQADGISERDYRRLSDLIRSESGIEFSPAKRTMIETRLGKRARALHMPSLSAYCDYVTSREGRREEWPRLIDAVTTHKTDFFREPAHFDYLVDHAVPELTRVSGAGLRRPLLVWSSACSTGEEPYTLAMVLTEYARSVPSAAFRFQIEATDISQGVLETALAAVYQEAAVEPVPEALRRRYLLRSRQRDRQQVRIAPEIRARVAFRPLNLMDANYGFADPLDIVFCRNVMIYFERQVQHQVLLRIAATLRKDGYLVMGHSESLNGLDLPLSQVAPTVYRRMDA